MYLMNKLSIDIGGVDLPWLSNQSIANTVILILITLIGRFLLIRMIKGTGETLSDARRRWISIIQNTTILFAALGLIFIWSPQLSTFALSLTAFVIALVVATKEYILCLVGAIYRATSNPFSLGDWIEIQGLRGEVLTEGILTTKLQELGSGSSRFQFTGRILTLPNSLLLTQTVFNEEFRKYALHHKFKVTVESGIDAAQIAETVLPLLQSRDEKSDKLAEKNWQKSRKSSQMTLPSRDPNIAIETNDAGKICFIMTVFCTPQDAAEIEALVTNKILSAVTKVPE